MQQATSRSGSSDMTASDAESWARLRLVQGESTAQKWELVSSLGHTTLTVGSNVDCTWVVREEGVRPIHFSLHWDGNLLRVADVYSAGDVRVDGTLLTSQWRPLLGRVRIEFGRAAMVVETSSSQPQSSSTHPLEPAPLELKPSEMKSPPGRGARKGNETLIGVAPMTLGVPSSAPPPAAQSFGPPAGSAPPPAEPGAEPSRVARNVAGNSMKATLVGGIGITPGSLPPTAGGSSPPPGATPAGVNPKAKPNATLMGFNVVDSLRGAVGTQPFVGGGGLQEDQRTAQGFPHGAAKAPSSMPPAGKTPQGRRMTQQGMVSQPPSSSPEAVAQVPVRPVTSPARDPKERIGAAWQEMPDASSPVGGATLKGVPDEESASERRPQESRRAPQPRWDTSADRMSDIPTSMRDPASFESRRVRRGFPWRYVGVLVLTGVAYFAWLYLLDHM